MFGDEDDDGFAEGGPLVVMPDAFAQQDKDDDSEEEGEAKAQIRDDLEVIGAKSQDKKDGSEDSASQQSSSEESEEAGDETDQK